ncbi:2-keto-4-pentenoate hydratase [Parasphingorhabdus sp. DH2-15]|uniref:2-keto-4-pentenoate hydratase n=1 Tax=Parasphingorhabdus sp. DH2-15 TaxID=3444112 RepID=UPI003F68949D
MSDHKDITERHVPELKPSLQHISQKLMAARHAATGLPGFPGKLPETLTDAYTVQHISREIWPDRVAGWKVAGMPTHFVESLGVTRLAGPIFSNSIVRARQDSVAEIPIFDGGSCAIEPEFIIELGNSRADDRMYIGAEIAGSPIPAINNLGPIAVICDFGNNNGMLLGPEIEDWQSKTPDTLVVEAHIDGEMIATRALEDLRKGPLEAVDFLLDHAKKHGISMPAGTFVSSGAITGVHEANIGTQAHLNFGCYGSLDMVLVRTTVI